MLETAKMTLLRPMERHQKPLKCHLRGMVLTRGTTFGDLLIQGKIESPIMPLDESLEIMNQMDKIRKAWKLVYPMDIG